MMWADGLLGHEVRRGEGWCVREFRSRLTPTPTSRDIAGRGTGTPLARLPNPRSLTFPQPEITFSGSLSLTIG